MQRKVSSTVLTFHCQLTGTAIAGRLYYARPNGAPLAALIPWQACAYRVLRTLSLDLRNVIPRAAI